MAKLSDARVDLDAEREGVWRECPFLPGFRVKIASADVPEFESAMLKRLDPYRDLIRADGERPEGDPPKFTAEMLAAIENEALADLIVRDWSGAEDDDGRPVPCSRDEVLKVLGDTALHRIREWIRDEAQRWSNYRAVRKAKAMGN